VAAKAKKIKSSPAPEPAVETSKPVKKTPAGKPKAKPTAKPKAQPKAQAKAKQEIEFDDEEIEFDDEAHDEEESSTALDADDCTLQTPPPKKNKADIRSADKDDLKQQGQHQGLGDGKPSKKQRVSVTQGDSGEVDIDDFLQNLSDAQKLRLLQTLHPSAVERGISKVSFGSQSFNDSNDTLHCGAALVLITMFSMLCTLSPLLLLLFLNERMPGGNTAA
jgi:hypothetical protein